MSRKLLYSGSCAGTRASVGISTRWTGASLFIYLICLFLFNRSNSCPHIDLGGYASPNILYARFLFSKNVDSKKVVTSIVFGCFVQAGEKVVTSIVFGCFFFFCSGWRAVPPTSPWAAESSSRSGTRPLSTRIGLCTHS